MIFNVDFALKLSYYRSLERFICLAGPQVFNKMHLSLSLLLTKLYCFVGRHVGSLGNKPEREGFLFMNILVRHPLNSLEAPLPLFSYFYQIFSKPTPTPLFISSQPNFLILSEPTLLLSP